MNKLISGGLLALVLATGVTTYTFSTDSASADDHEENVRTFQEGENYFDDIVKEISLTDSGVILTITTDNADALEVIQERVNEDHEGGPNADEVTHEATLLSNGVQIEISVIDESNTELIAQIQEHAGNGPGDFEKGERGERDEGDHTEGPEFADEITKTVTLTSTGASISLTSENAEAVTAIQERFNSERDGGPLADEVSHDVTLLDNGVQVDVSALDSSDSELIGKIQEHAESGHGQRGERGGQRGPQ
jgi:hypothetical protein